MKLKMKIGKAEPAPGEQSTIGGTDEIAARNLYPDPRDEFATLREQLLIDRNALDDEVVRQPVLFQEVSEQFVMAQSEAAGAKEKLAGVDASLAHDLRTKWNFAGEKFTEGKLDEVVQGSPKHIVAYDHWSRLARRAAYLGALKDSYEQRSRMLRELGQLFVSGYFSRATSGATKRETDAAAATAGREGMNKLRQKARE
jgi:hypothetical protein